ncbi:MAG TPA: PP2C family protein-serine/threonine phosphatase [Terriglobales bacterium]|nr:PP2C family protein-serine/threonine phosphatase [Terriglobales bacterium]
MQIATIGGSELGTRIPRTYPGLAKAPIFELEATSVYTKECAELIERCERLQVANSRLLTLQKEFEDDLEAAARVQRHLEPRPAVWGRVRVDTFSQPARTIGGDFGMVYPRDDQHLNLALCDVSGHGFSSALTANRIYTEMRTLLQMGTSLGDVLSLLNRSVIRDFINSSFFFTIAAARLDFSGRHLVFAGAGHPPGMVIKPGADPQLLEARSMILGALPDAVCHEPMIEIGLDPGDRILLYTDGITEVFDKRGEMLGVEGLQSFVRETSLLPFDEMLPAILERVAAWRHGPCADDVTIILAEVLE